MANRDLGNPVLIALVWLCGSSAFLLLYWGSKLTFLLDDWEFLVYRRGFSAESILEPHGEHISIGPVLIYKALQETVGMSSALPFRVVSTAMFILSAALFFTLLLRRVGQYPALGATVLVLFVGAAWEDLLWAFQVGYFTSMAAGLGMLLALEREDRRGDLVACLLLAVSLVFSSLGLPFAVAAAVAIGLRPRPLKRLYVVAIPLALFALWWLGWGHSAESHLSAANVAKTPGFVLDGIASSMASIFGLFTPGAAGIDWGRPLAVAAIGLGLWRLSRIGRISTWFWVMLALGGSFWVLAGLNQIPDRTPMESRYQYVAVIFTLLVAAELLRGVRFDRLALVAGAVAVAAITVSNVGYLHAAWESYRLTSQLEKASLGAVEITRDTVEPDFILSEDLTDTAYVHIEAGPYLSAADEYGTPAYSPEELAESVPAARSASDKVMFGALGADLVPVPGSALPSGSKRAARVGGGGAIDVPATGCVRVPASPDGALLVLPPGGALVQAKQEPIENVRLSRYADPADPPVDLRQGLRAGQAGELALPPDRSRQPWTMRLETLGEAVACGLRRDTGG